MSSEPELSSKPLALQPAVVLTLDGVNANYLGPYGNTWIETPGWNRLAAESLLMEHAIVESHSIDDFLRSSCFGEHAWTHPNGSTDRSHFVTRLDPLGIKTLLITDDTHFAESPHTECFADRVLLPAPAAASSAAAPQETHTAHIIAAGLQHLTSVKQPGLMWLHATALRRSWDAPIQLRQQFADLDDPIPPDFVLPPRDYLPATTDPDVILGLQHAYAGEICALDALLDDLLDVVAGMPQERQPLLVVTSNRGYPLGEHRSVGDHDPPALFTEMLHVPLLIRFPGGQAAAVRSQSLWQPHLLPQLLLDWFQVSTGGARLMSRLQNDEPLSILDYAFAASANEFALRTNQWFLRCARPLEHLEPAWRQLYLKPDDARDVNDVADRCADVAMNLIEQARTILTRT